MIALHKGDDSRDEVPLTGLAIDRARYRNPMNSSRDGGRNADADRKELAYDPLAPIEPPIGSNRGAQDRLKCPHAHAHAHAYVVQKESLPACACKAGAVSARLNAVRRAGRQRLSHRLTERTFLSINHNVHQWELKRSQEGGNGDTLDPGV